MIFSEKEFFMIIEFSNKLKKSNFLRKYIKYEYNMNKFLYICARLN